MNWPRDRIKHKWRYSHWGEEALWRASEAMISSRMLTLYETRIRNHGNPRDKRSNSTRIPRKGEFTRETATWRSRKPPRPLHKRGCAFPSVPQMVGAMASGSCEVRQGWAQKMIVKPRPQPPKIEMTASLGCIQARPSSSCIQTPLHLPFLSSWQMQVDTKS